MAQRFTGVLEAARGGGAVVALPDHIVTALGAGRRFRVTGTISAVPFHSSTMSVGGCLYLGVHKSTRAAAGVDIGDTIELTVERDTAPRVLTLPDDLAAALADDPRARAAFEGLSFTHRREYVEWVAGAKRAETRARRIAQTLERGVGGRDGGRRAGSRQSHA